MTLPDAADARPAPLPWEDFLPALEEWTRRTGALLRGELDGGPDEVAPAPAPLAVVPAGPVPPALAGRAVAAHEELARLEALGAARRAGLRRAQAYART